jgi:hypothetical protein
LWFGAAVVEFFDALEEACPEVANFRESELLADAETRAAVEGNVLPGLRLPVPFR